MTINHLFLLRKRELERKFRRKFVPLVFRIITSLSLLFSAALPAAAEMQYPAGTAADNPYDYVSSGTVTNPADSGTEITAATLTENPYSADTAQCNTDVNNGTYNLSYTPTLSDDLYIYQLTKTTTNLKNNQQTVETKELGASFKPMYKLLNVYPGQYGKIGERLMTGLRSDGKHFYEDPATGEQLFTFDSVYWDTFMANPESYMKNPDGSWKYDGIYFGAQDGNGAAHNGTQIPGGVNKDFSSASLPFIRDYINQGYAVVQGHDIPLEGLTNAIALFQPYFNFRLTKQPWGSINDCGAQNICYCGSAAYVSNSSGTGAGGSSAEGNPLTRYPYKYNIGSQLSISYSHMQWWPHVNSANVWLTYSNASRVVNGYYSDAYLYTSKNYPNVASSQAGHSDANENDMKLIVNMLLYILPKRNSSNSTSMDVKDIAAPAQPAITNQKRTGKTNLMFNVAAEDFATKFDFSLQSKGVYNNSTKPAVTMDNATIKSGTTWYLYSADTDENGTVSYTTNCLGLPVASGETTMIEGGAADTLSVTIPANARYLHIAAVDQVGNVSEVTTVEIPRTEDLTVRKVFEDFDNRYNLRPAEIIFDAFAGSNTTSSGDCTANEDNEYTCTINDLLAYDANGDEVTYTVKERNTPNAYTASEPTVVIAQEKNVTVTNTLVTQEIPVKKIWSDGNNQDGIRPGSISFTLFCGSTECGDNPYTITKDNDWTITIPNIPTYDSEGHAYEHSVVESDF